MQEERRVANIDVNHAGLKPLKSALFYEEGNESFFGLEDTHTFNMSHIIEI